MLRPMALGVSLLLGGTVLGTPILLHAQSATPRNTTTATTFGATDGNAAAGIAATGTGINPTTATTAKQPTKKRVTVVEDGTGTGLNDRTQKFVGEEKAEEATDFGRMNLRETSTDGLTASKRPLTEETPGVRLGTFVLRPSITETIGTESTRTSGTRDNRTFLQTGLKGSLTSDWSRHALTITGDGIWQRNISGTAETEPQANIDADLRLDLARDTRLDLTAGYSFSREDTDDPNAISGADVQSGVHTFSSGIKVERDFGILRGSSGVELERQVYTDAVLADGSNVSLKDRDRLTGTLRGRIGYELSPALIPFIEASIGRSRYDRRLDDDGFARAARNYAGRVGLEVDLGEKLRGELGIGYQRSSFDDDRLKALGGASVEGNIAWSPQRGTDVTVGLSTTVEPSTTAGESGYLSYALNAGIAHEVREHVIARLTGSSTLRDYQSSATEDETIYVAGTGLTWGLNRYLDLTGDISYERTARKTNADTQVLRAGIGLTLKR